jgi:hypothetical protein
MKKLLITLCLSTVMSLSCSCSKISFLGRLGFLKIFNGTQRTATVVSDKKHADISKLPIHTPNRSPLREFFPIQPCSDSALARKGLQLLTTKVTAPFKVVYDFFKPHQYRNPQIDTDFAHIHTLLRAASGNNERMTRNNLVTPKIAPAA